MKISEYVKNLIYYIDKDQNSNDNGSIELSEYQAYLKFNKMPLGIATKLFELFNTDGNKDSLSEEELIAGYKKFDTASANDVLTFNEMLALQNQLTGITIDTSVTQNQYNSLFSMSDKFLKAMDKDNDGNVSLEEIKKFLTDNKQDASRAQVYIDYYDQNKDKSINIIEYQKKLIDLDTNKDGQITQFEALPFQNLLRENHQKIDVSQTNATQYNQLYSVAANFFNKIDADKNGKISLEEYQKVLEANNYDVESAKNFINFFNANGDQEVDFYEYLNKSIKMDANGDGKIDETEAEALTKQLRKLTNIEITAKNMVKALDTSKDGVINYTEYEEYAKKNKLPQNVTSNIMKLYAGNDNALSYEEIVKAMNSFDKDADGSLNVSEALAFQNSYNDIKFDVNMEGSQYSNLYKIAQNFMKLDTNNDGAVDLEEYRGAIAAQNKKANATQTPEYYAENLIMMFDQEQTGTHPKDGKIDIYEYMQGLMQFDGDKDGKLSAAESLNFKNQMDNAKFFEAVNKIVVNGDYSNDKNITLEELKVALVADGLPDYLAKEAFVLFDRDDNDKLSTLELMLAFKQFDVNNNNDIEINEKLAFYQLLSKNTVNLNLNPANIKQYTQMFESLQEYIKENDNSNDSLIDAVELRKYFSDKKLPAYLADEAIRLFDVNKDKNLDILEFMRMNLTYDTNKNGNLELNEELNLHQVLSGIQLNATEQNKVQYENLYNEVKKVIEQFDADKDKMMDEEEIKQYFISKNIPEEIAAKFIEKYDVSKESKIDALELLAAFIANDKNKSGKLELDEELTMQGSLIGIDLGATSQNRAQYTLIYNTIQNIIKDYDRTGNKELDLNELKAYFRANNLPEDLAQSLITMYDNTARKNGNINLLEWMKAYIQYDVDKSGSLDFSETLEMNSQLAGVTLNSSIANQKQYELLYNYTNQIIKSFDKNNDNKLNEEELAEYLVSKGFSASLAKQAFINNNISADGALDVYELLKANIAFDVNKNGVLDANELLAQNASYANVSISLDADSAKQTTGNFQTASNVIAAFDRNKDNNLSQEELRLYFKSLGLPEHMADTFMTKYNTDGGAGINNLELMNAFIKADKDKSGTLEFDETINMYSDISGVALNVTSQNQTQVSNLWNYAKQVMNFSTAGNGELTLQNVRSYFASLGVSQSTADDFFNANKNANGTVDMMTLTKAFLNVDNSGTKQDGSFDFQDWITLFSNATGVDIDVTPANKAQVENLWNYTKQIMAGYSSAGNGELTQQNVRNYFATTLGVSESIADSFFNANKNANGTVDMMRFTKAFLDIDNLGIKQDGSFDFQDLMKFYSQFSGVNINVTSQNQTQINNLWNYTKQIMAEYSSAKNGELTQQDVRNYFATAFGQPSYIADNFFNANKNANGTVDMMRFTKAFLDIDNLGIKQDGSFDFQDLMKFYSQLSGVNINVTSQNQAQLNGLWSDAMNVINTYDTKDKELSETEVANWFKTAGMTQEMARNYIRQVDRNNNGLVDATEILQAHIILDQNKSGVIETHELVKLLEIASGIDLTSGYASTVQLTGLYSAASGMFAYDLDKDCKLNSSEIEAYLGANRYSATQIQNAKNTLLTNGYMDFAQWIKILENFDTNKNGIWDSAEDVALRSSLS